MRIELSRHAVERFQERVRPSLTGEQAEVELRRLVNVAEVSSEMPSFVFNEHRKGGPPDGWAVICDGVALPLHRMPSGRWMAVTCLAHMHLSDETRRRRNRARSGERRRRRDLRMLGINETGARLHPELCE